MSARRTNQAGEAEAAALRTTNTFTTADGRWVLDGREVAPEQIRNVVEAARRLPEPINRGDDMFGPECLACGSEEWEKNGAHIHKASCAWLALTRSLDELGVSLLHLAVEADGRFRYFCEFHNCWIGADSHRYCEDNGLVSRWEHVASNEQHEGERDV